MSLSDQRNRLVGSLDAMRNRHVLGTCQGRLRAEQIGLGPINQSIPHFSDEYERSVLDVFHLQELPDHHQLEHGPISPGATTKASEVSTK